jgi:hypothetical protein
MGVLSRLWEPRVRPGWLRPHRDAGFTPSRPMRAEGFASSGTRRPLASQPRVKMDKSGSGIRWLELKSSLCLCPRPGLSSLRVLPQEIGWLRPPARRCASGESVEAVGPVELLGMAGPTPLAVIAVRWRHWLGRLTVDRWASPAMAE